MVKGGVLTHVKPAATLVLKLVSQTHGFVDTLGRQVFTLTRHVSPGLFTCKTVAQIWLLAPVKVKF